MSKHAEVRSQQRGIPPFVIQLLDKYGVEEYVGRGSVKRYFNKKSIRNMERDMWREPVSKFTKWYQAYEVVSTDGELVTVGYVTKRIWRKS